MLLDFTFSNWACFHRETHFTMRGTRERTNDETVHRLEKYREAKVLPVTAIFGANASGKTQFVEALAFARDFITGTIGLGKAIPVSPFLLTKEALSTPVAFSFLISVEEILWRYSFAVTPLSVVSESLVLVRGTSEQEMFSRDGRRIVVARHLPNHDRLSLVAEGVRENQLFLNNLVYQNVPDFVSVFNWFKDNLIILTPASYFRGIDQLADRGNPLHASLQQALASLDTGIAELAPQALPMESIPITQDVRERLERELQEGEVYREKLNGETFLVQKRNGRLEALRIVAVHPTNRNEGVQFPLSMESDGTRRLIDLLPAFADLGDPKSKTVFVIDELDRGLHTLVLEYLVRMFVSQSTNRSRSQIIFTTQNVEVMSKNLLRRDEMWLVEKNSKGEARLVPFSDFNGAMRNDSDIRRSYLQGRLGGIPRIVPFVFSDSGADAEQSGSYPMPADRDDVAPELTPDAIPAIAMEAAP